MQLNSACLKCILEKQLDAADKIAEEEQRLKYLQKVMLTLGEAEHSISAPVVVDRLGAVQKEFMGEPVSYEKEKKFYNDLLLGMEKELRKLIESDADPLKKALLLSRRGNYIDYGAMKSVGREEFLSFLNGGEEAIAEDVYGKFLQDLERARGFVLLCDNCGEVVLDKLFLEQLGRRFPELSITAVVRGEAVLNDVTLKDALYIGMDRVTGLLENGSSIAGTALEYLPAQVREVIEKADVVLSKGQGNFETIHGCGLNIYYLFLCKCGYFVEKFGLAKFDGVFCREYDWNDRQI